MAPLALGALSIAKFALPRIADWIFDDGGDDVAKDVIAIAEKVTGLGDPDDQLAALRANPEMLLEMQRLGDALEIRYLTENTKRLESINETMQAESQSDDKYVSRWRPTIGYVVAFQLAMLGIAVFAVVIGGVYAAFDGKPDVVKVLFEGLATLMAAMTAILGIELTILGVNITQRSKDKQVKAGFNPGPGILGALAARIAPAREK